MSKFFKSQSIPFYATILFLISLLMFYLFDPTFKSHVNEGFEIFSNDTKGDEEDWINQFGSWGPVIILLGFLFQMFLMFIPSVLLMTVSIVLYGSVKGGILALGGILFTSFVGYVLGSFLGKKSLQNLLGEKSEKQWKFYVERYGMIAIIISRFSPFLSIDALSLIAGVLKMNFWKFILASSIGIVPLIGLIIYFDKNPDQFKAGLIWFSIISLIAFGVFIFVDNKIRKKE